MIPQPGDIVLITGRCGAQFRARRVHVRITKVETFGHTPDHMVWLAGYEVDQVGLAVEHRPHLLVEHAGVELIHRPEPTTAGRARNAGPARIPQQRAKTTFRSHR